jgi:Ser/Thr protein kinase RdoA (MazF antagonist)
MLKDHITVEHLASHLEARCSLKLGNISKLDLNVYHVECSNSENYVARVFFSKEYFGNISALSKLLNYLEANHYPAERIVSRSANAVTEIDESLGGGSVMLTTFVPGRHPERNRVTFYKLGVLLSQLHSLPIPEDIPSGGSWHHLSITGGVQEECDAAIRMLDNLDHDQRNGDRQKLCDELKRLKESFAEKDNALPKCLVHPDFVPANIIAREGSDNDWTIVDWLGAGLGHRILSLGFLLAVGAIRGKLILVHAIMKGYGSKIKLEESELELLPQATYARLFTIKCWEVGVGRKTPTDALKELPTLLEMAKNVSRTVKEIANTKPKD